jgi:hypothetical protein
MSSNNGSDPALMRFLDASTAFMSWVDTYDPARSDLVDLHACIADLQAALLRLPHDNDDIANAESDEDEMTAQDLDESAEADADYDFRGIVDQRAVLMQRLSALPITHYRVVFDSLEDDPDGLVTGWLADDLTDIYRDLKTGLAEWEAGHAEDAIWEWRFAYFSHWGRHATHAQSAILDYLRNEADY